MRFLVDAQLPPALAGWLADRGHDAKHVVDLDMLAGSDRDIWKIAADGGYVLLTKDRDFIEWALEPRATVQVVWVRIGNAGNASLIRRWETGWAQILEGLQSGVRVVEVGRE